MSKQIRVGDILKIDDFDPMEVDVSYVEETIKLLPRDGMIDLNQAESLATSFLRCADYCSNLISQSIRLLGNRDANKKSQKGTAIQVKIESKIPATTAREVYGNDPNYIEACNKHTEAQAWTNWITQKYDNLIRAHVLCKDIMKSHTQGRNMANWEATEDFSKPVEKTKDSEKTNDKKISKRDTNNNDLDFDVDLDDL